MTAYTTPDLMAAYLATTFTPEQATQAQLAADAVTAWIDHRTGRSWQGPTVILDEIHDVVGNAIYLDQTPVATIEEVEQFLPDGWVVVDPSAYVLVAPSRGAVAIYVGGPVRVDYTTAGVALPADLGYAATVLASDLIGPTLDPDLAGVESLSVGQNDITLKYGGGASGSAADGPAAAVAVVDSYRGYVFA